MNNVPASSASPLISAGFFRPLVISSSWLKAHALKVNIALTDLLPVLFPSAAWGACSVQLSDRREGGVVIRWDTSLSLELAAARPVFQLPERGAVAPVAFNASFASKKLPWMKIHLPSFPVPSSSHVNVNFSSPPGKRNITTTYHASHPPPSPLPHIPLPSSRLLR